MRRRQLKRLWLRLRQLRGMRLKREALLMKLGAARANAASGLASDRHQAAAERWQLWLIHIKLLWRSSACFPPAQLFVMTIAVGGETGT
jgi:hypothetical protein